MVVATFSFGVASVYMHSKYSTYADTSTCNTGMLTNFMIANAVLDLTIGAILCIILTYGVASTRNEALENVAGKVINILRPAYSLVPSLGLMIGLTIVFFRSSCVSTF
jgi:uncharacterized protein YacL